jgi:hypothetical protein
MCNNSAVLLTAASLGFLPCWRCSCCCAMLLHQGPDIWILLLPLELLLCACTCWGV